MEGNLLFFCLHNHHVLVPLPPHGRFHIGTVCKAIHEFLHFLPRIFLVRELPPAQPHGDLYEMVLRHKSPCLIRKAIEIVLIGPKSETHHLDLRLLTPRPRPLLLLLQLIEVRSAIQNLTNRRHGIRGNFDEIKLLLFCSGNGICQREHFLRLIGYKADFLGADLFIDAEPLINLSRDGFQGYEGKECPKNSLKGWNTSIKRLCHPE